MTSRSKKRVCLVIHGAGWAGTERHVRSLAEKLPGRGFDVHLITSESGPLQDQARVAGTRIHLVPRLSRWDYVRKLFVLLRSLDPDILHAHSGRIPAWVARVGRVPLVLDTRHGLLERLDPGLENQGWRWRLAVVKCWAAHRTLTVAEADRQWLIRAGLSANRVTTVYNGVTLPTGLPHGPTLPEKSVPAGAASGPVRIGLVGRLTRQKAPERALELMEHLQNSHPGRFALSVFGDGEDRDALIGRASRSGLDGCVRWEGVVDNLIARLSELDILMLPSRAEGIPYVLLEALANGVPVIATPVGGIGEILCSSPLLESLLPWDLATWSVRVEEMSRPGFRDSWSIAAEIRMRALSEERMVDRIVELYGGPNLR